MSVAASSLEQLLDQFRPEVRRTRPYKVARFADINAKLNQNESPYDLPPTVRQRILDLCASNPFNRYPTEQPERLVRILADYAGVESDQVLVSRGSNEFSHTLGLSFMEHGRTAVLPRPMFALFDTTVRLYGGAVVSVDPNEDLSFDTDAVCRAIEQHHPALTVLATPNNPTGLTMTISDVERVARCAEGFVVVDEAYHEFTSEPSAIALIDELPNVIVMRTLSKAIGLAGCRVGYAIAHRDVIAGLMGARLPFLTDGLTEALAIAVLEDRDRISANVAAMKTSVAALERFLGSIRNVAYVPSDTNFVIFRTSLSAPMLIKELAARGVAVRDMSGYEHLRGYVRVSAGTEPENRIFMDALNSILGKS